MTGRPVTISLTGGLDLVTPAVAVPSGRAIACLNYECGARGYTRSAGYERFDGQPSPSAASFWRQAFTTGTTAIAKGDVITGATSGATAIVLEAAVPESGDWATNDAAGDVFAYNLTGTFTDGEDLQVSAATVAVASEGPVENDTADDALRKARIIAAADERRAVILQIPGSGPVRGVFTYKGDVYGIRDNAGATAGVLHKAETGGWVAQSFGHTIDFNTSTARFEAGETLTGGTSGATATIERVVKQSGDWGSTGAGYLVLSGVSGTFQAAETITSASGSATATAAQAAVTLPAGGTYQAVVHNFYGASNRVRAYLASGAGRAMEWDGTVMAPARTGLSDALDKPKYIAVISNHLLLGFDGGAVMNSGTGEPLTFEVVAGAAEQNLGEDITGIKASQKGAVVITGRNKIAYLTGKDSSDFFMKEISEDSGAVANTLEVVGKPLFLDDLGIRDMTAAQSFGDWKMGTITYDIEPILSSLKKDGVVPVGAMRVRSKDQYRLFYSDGRGISIYFGRRKPECMIFKVPFTPSVLTSGEDSSGYEVLFAGDSDGWVYQIDKGGSFDGGEVEAYLRTAYLHQGNPMQEKRYQRGYLEMDTGLNGAQLAIAADFSYGSADRPAASEVPFSAVGGGGFWDALYWNRFNWSAPFQASGFFDLDGIGQNLSLVFMSDAADEEPHTLSTLSVFVSPRRTLR